MHYLTSVNLTATLYKNIVNDYFQTPGEWEASSHLNNAHLRVPPMPCKPYQLSSDWDISLGKHHSASCDWIAWSKQWISSISVQNECSNADVELCLGISIPTEPYLYPVVHLICIDGLQISLRPVVSSLINPPMKPVHKMEEGPKILLVEGSMWCVSCYTCPGVASAKEVGEDQC